MHLWRRPPFPISGHVDPAAKLSTDLPKTSLRLLADENFAPYSFAGVDGLQIGVSIDLARAACAELRITCEIVTMPFAQLLPALQRGEGDLIITGVRIDADVLESAEPTRPYYMSAGRFVMRVGTKLEDTSTKSLSGRKLGYVKATSHAAFIERYYNRSALLPFDTEAAMLEALRTGTLDVAFGDAMHMAFWIAGKRCQKMLRCLGRRDGRPHHHFARLGLSRAPRQAGPA